MFQTNKKKWWGVPMLVWFYWYNFVDWLKVKKSNAIDNIQFMKYLWKDRAKLRKLYKFEKIETDSVKKVVQYLDATDRELRRTRGMSLRGNLIYKGKSGYYDPASLANKEAVESELWDKEAKKKA